MKTLVFLFSILLPILSFAQSVGDTIVIPTFNYTQTQSPQGRDTMIMFPDNPGQTYEKIIMAYNMRCKDGLVSNGTNTNLGCGEWDYKCNTYIYDSTRVDSVLSFINSHTISNFSGSTFEYVEDPMYDYYQYIQKEVIVNNIISETESTVGAGSLSLNHVLPTSFKAGKSQFLFTDDELSSSGLLAGDIDGITVNVLNNGNSTDFFRLCMKQTSQTELSAINPELVDFTEVYFNNATFTAGENRIQFHTPFTWDGSSNIIIEYSFTNPDMGIDISIEGEDSGNNFGLHSSNDNFLYYTGANYVETNSYKGISGANDRTCEAWVKTTVPNKEIISWGKNSATEKWVFRLNDDGTVRVEVNGGAIYGTTVVSDGQWHHVACTFTGTNVNEVLLYVDGELDDIASALDKAVNTNTEDGINLRVSRGVNDRYFVGNIDEARVWEASLSQTELQEWMYKTIDPSHPNYSNLKLYYNFDEGDGNEVSDLSGNDNDAAIINGSIWGYEHGVSLFKGLTSTSERPNTTFLQGEYDLTISDVLVEEIIEQIPNSIIEYEVIPNWGTMIHDSIAEVLNALYWQAGYEYIYDPGGILTDSLEVLPTGTINITELTYYNRYPSRFELMSFVTPYGIYLDLGMDGKTWYFDVTDYTPILKGWKRMTVELGGQRQEDLDIKFMYIVGTPPRDVIDINQIWRPASKGYQDIMNDRAFEPREFKMNADGEYFKIKSVITGHGQEGEFIGRWHTLNIDGGEIEYTWKVWTECSTIPIYPQGGTWLYDRAGWCPGDPSDIYEYDITELVSPGQTHTIDYSITAASGSSSYLVNKQLVTYGAANFEYDASVINITKPNASAAFERFNPACSYPIALIQNTGSSTLTSFDIEYFVEGGEVLNYTWTGSIDFLDSVEIELEIPNYSFWIGSANKFTVTVSNPNGQTDDYPYNNSYTINFEEVDLYDISEGPFTIECKTNLQGYQTSYSISDLDGNIILEVDDLENNTIYTDEVTLGLGCYKLRINDSGDNGLYYWHQSQYGSGYFRLKDNNGTILENFEPEFGRFAVYEFSVVDFTGNNEIIDEAKSISIFPNPTTDKVNVKLRGYENSNVIVEVFDAGMIKVYESKFPCSNTNFKKSISIQSQPPGVYLLRIECNGRMTYHKIIKI